MAKPYSDDLRQKVMQAIVIDGMDKTEASRVFNISRNTIYLWLKRQARSGSYKALPNRPPGNNHKIIDWDKFRQFVEIHGDKTQAQMADLWPEEISQRTISRALKKIGFTRKKKHSATKRETRKNEMNFWPKYRV
jgi:transposase